jgi:predicted enzyme involved in methoxymalonyl-ACP biosynthesis
MLADIDDVVQLLKQMLTAAATAHAGVQLVVHGFGNCANVLPVIGGDRENHPANRLAIANQRLRSALASDLPGVVVIDQAGIEATVGTSNLRDERLYFLAGIRFTDTLMRTMAAYQAAVLSALLGKTRKCLVLDCDHTLWGGVVGEDGTHGVHIGGSSNPGNAFAAFQKGIKRLQSRGVILAVLSKNNEQDALDVFQKHPGMLIRETDRRSKLTTCLASAVKFQLSISGHFCSTDVYGHQQFV